MRRCAAIRIGVSGICSIALLGLLALALVFVGAGSAGNTGKAPLIGANYTHYAFPGCSLNDTGIVLTYNRPSVRTIVRRQLAAMRAAGIQTLRLLLWHITDASGMRWGIVSSGSGQLSEPYRSNLIRYLSDVRKAGFEQLTLVFAPEGNDAPLPPAPGNVYDPTKFDVNWRFIRDVRPLLKSYGPDSTHVDLLNEAAPPAWERPTVITQTKTYITNMWSKYLDAFGGEDASFSSVGADGPGDTSARLQNLIDALRASGRPLPRWFDVHPPYDHDGTLAVLRAVDATLTATGLSQPLVLGESAYDDPAVASAIREFEAAAARPILEVMEWPLRAGRSCGVSAPYRAEAYIEDLTSAAPPAAVTATVSPLRGIQLRTAYGGRVTALEAGLYRIAVTDASRSDDFHLIGPGVNRRTGLARTGKAKWTLRLRQGTYRYHSDRPDSKLSRGSFVVLRAG
jgi:hypothetical protein